MWGSVLLLTLGGLLAATAPTGAACRCYRDLATDGVCHNRGAPFTVLTVEQVICTDPATGAASTHRSLRGFEPLPASACACGPPRPLSRAPRGEGKAEVPPVGPLGRGGRERLAEIAGGLAFAAALIGSWLHLAGWTNAFRYFGHYRLGLAPLEIPEESFFQ